LVDVVIDALELPATDAFNRVRVLSREAIRERLNRAGLSGLEDKIMEGIELLKRQAAGTSHDLNDKFMTSAKFELTYGSLSLFYGGLESLIGPPKMVAPRRVSRRRSCTRSRPSTARSLTRVRSSPLPMG